MSYKSALSNSIKSNCDTPQWIKAQSVETNVKFAGEEAKDRLYEPKHKKKLVRVLTVVAYIFFVSLAAIMLSLYYVFLYKPNPKIPIKVDTANATKLRCDLPAGVLSQSLRMESIESTTLMPDEEIPTTEILDTYVIPSSRAKLNLFVQKLMYDTNYLNDTFK